MKNGFALLPFFLLPAALPLRAQAPLNDRDLRDVANDRYFSALNLNRSTAASLAAAATEAQHPLHYYDPAWRPGTVVGPDGQSRTAPGVRYNLVQYWLEVQDPTVPGGLRVLPVGSFRGFTLVAAGSEPERQFGAYRGPGPNGRLVLEELTRFGPVRLLLRHEVEFVPAVQNMALHLETSPAKEQRFSSLYAVGTGQPGAQPLPLARKAVLRLFGPDAPALASYAADHRLNFDNLTDVTRLVEHYNQLARPAPAR